MKKGMFVLVVALVLTLALVASAQGPGTWTESPGNPIFGEGAGGPKAYYPSVLYDADSFSGHGAYAAKYMMWYGTSSSQTGLATSDDGISWEARGAVMTDGYHATVEYYPDGFTGAYTGDNSSGSEMYYRMWYWDVGALYHVSAIGYTESPNGVNWYNYQSCQNGSTVPLVTAGPATDWNRGSYGPATILYNPSASNTGTDWTFAMYHDGTTGGTESIGLGFSSDGITWTGYDADNDGKADPVLVGTNVWDYNYVSRATIIKNADDDYEMWYSGGVGAMNHGIGYATSSDGINWTRDADNPILHKSDTGYPGYPWRQSRTYCPMVIKDGTSYKMWFSGKGIGGYSIGYATVAPSIVPMSEFQIEHAKLDFKKKPDDDKVHVRGTLELDLVDGDGVDILEAVTVTVGPLFETITMEEKGKKGDKWEYKCRKDGEGIIKHMTIDWKNGRFDIRIDDADLTGVTNPVTISIQIGDDVGSESILMKEHKHHWDYKAEKPKKPKGVEIEPLAVPDEVTVVAYPNPIRDVNTATFQVMGTLAAQVEEIRVQIYDLSGHLVWEDGALGSELDWHTDSLSGDYLANGIYLYRVQVRIGGSWINQDIGKIAVLR